MTGVRNLGCQQYPVKVSEPPGAPSVQRQEQNRWEICGEQLME